ncbi:NADH-quinone oxidoreductase subunit C [Lignipirellula cremea]|uniref:NADH-quinone oxidoreductase subunit C n=1 Tax=Lignipirellula cremea TaxID=2528010 RepID=A0A518DUT6_9BACT|nr:NADH-quinone oxidoreductase subunit C [Lignipirellula cremea]QDU95602.1 NAD(P)H-quinone oxidoreductase subunit J [Lignipirellula cremea]
MSLLEQLQAKFGDNITGHNLEAVDPWIEVAPVGIVDVCQFLKTAPDLQFDMLSCISGVDYWMADEKKMAKAGWEPHTEVVYHLSSTVKKHTLVLKVMLPRWKDDVEGQLPEVASVTSVWRTADWHEREVFDLSGVRFVGHPYLRRILCPEDWVGFPLRRDYEMPLEYHGIRGR